MLYVWFLLFAALVVFAAVKLNHYGEVIQQKSSLSGMMVGTFLLAGATSLPELTTSMTAVWIDNPDIAVGNMLGSNVFNLLILAVFDLFYRRRKMFERVSENHRYSAILGIVLFVVVAGGLLMPNMVEVFGIGLDMLIVFGLYFLGIKWLSKHGEEPGAEEAGGEQSDLTLRHGVIGFAVAALVTFGAGSLLAITGDKIAVATGMNASFVGSFLIAATTSLPELVTVYTAFRMANYDMAMGSILGSNLFNLMLLALTDVFYRDSAITQAVSSAHMLTTVLGMVMGGVVLYSIFRKEVSGTWRYVLPSLITTAIYFITSYVMY